ncbi:hypothetical protein [Streptomyces sp. NPDC004008]
MALSETDLLKTGDAGLVELFRSSPPGEIPKGRLEFFNRIEEGRHVDDRTRTDGGPARPGPLLRFRA